jgi:signal transduction histidine kinase
MISAPISFDEEKRLNALKRYQILDTEMEQEYEELVKLASELCEVPISLITLIDSNRQWFKARLGLDLPETPRTVAFCAHAILNESLMTVEDATHDERFSDNPLVTNEPDIRFYAGMPLITPDGYKLGTLCVIDRRPRKLSPLQKRGLEVLANQVVKLLELRLKNRELSELVQLQSKMLSVISHDVRGPLNSLQVLLEFVGAESNPEEIKEVLEDALKLISNGRDLLENMLHWANSMHSGTGFNPSSFNLYGLSNKLLDSLSVKAKSKNTDLKNLVPENTQAYGDQQMILFVLRNLVANSLKFTENGIVEIAAENQADYLKISVKDTGCGIAEKDLPKLMQWESRHTTKGTKNEKGSGVGLLLSREFVQQHKGTLTIESVLGEGTKVSFSLPVYESQPDAQTALSGNM